MNWFNKVGLILFIDGVYMAGKYGYEDNLVSSILMFGGCFLFLMDWGKYRSE